MNLNLTGKKSNYGSTQGLGLTTVYIVAVTGAWYKGNWDFLNILINNTSVAQKVGLIAEATPEDFRGFSISPDIQQILIAEILF